MQLGIHIHVINEAYTSKCSFYDNDEIKKDNYSGDRIIRGLYKTRNNKIINADVNAALNIYKKYTLKSNSTNNKIDYLMSRGLTIPNRVLVSSVRFALSAGPRMIDNNCFMICKCFNVCNRLFRKISDECIKGLVRWKGQDFFHVLYNRIHYLRLVLGRYFLFDFSKDLVIVIIEDSL